jgi:hypothetical protein
MYNEPRYLASLAPPGDSDNEEGREGGGGSRLVPKGSGGMAIVGGAAPTPLGRRRSVRIFGTLLALAGGAAGEAFAVVVAGVVMDAEVDVGGGGRGVRVCWAPEAPPARGLMIGAGGGLGGSTAGLRKESADGTYLA